MEAEEFEQVEDDDDHEVEDDFGVLYDDYVDDELWENIDMVNLMHSMRLKCAPTI